MEMLAATVIGFLAFGILAGLLAVIYFVVKLREDFHQFDVDTTALLKSIQSDAKVSRKVLIPKGVDSSPIWAADESALRKVVKSKGRVIRRSEEEEAELEKPLNERKV
jgi:hypothetical protein